MRGRKPNEKNLTLDQKFDAAFIRMHDFKYDKNGKCVGVVRNSNLATLEETAVLLWNHEGRKTKRPFSEMYMHNIEKNALETLKSKLKQYGIKSFDDVISSHGKAIATAAVKPCEIR